MVTSPALTGTGAFAWSTFWRKGAASDAWSHSGVSVLSDGRVIFAPPGGGGLVIYDTVSGSAVHMRLPIGTAHGITTEVTDDDEFLWIADIGTSMAEGRGQLVRVNVRTAESHVVPHPSAAVRERWHPTSIVRMSRGTDRGDLWVADGYGENRIHRFRTDGGVESFTGAGGDFDCPHGLAVDDRFVDPVLVVADRSHQRLVFLDSDGEFLRELRHPLLTSPSCIARRGDDLLVTDLRGALLAVNLDDEVRAVIPHRVNAQRPGWPNSLRNGVHVRPRLRKGTLNSPHGIAVASDGAVYLTEWLIGGRQISLTFMSDQE